MPQTSHGLLMEHDTTTSTMKALVFRGPGDIRLEMMPIPKARAGEVVIRVKLTTICGTDLHILKGEYSVEAGLIIGHEPVGVIHEIGDGVSGYAVGDRVLVGAITPCGQSTLALAGTGRNAEERWEDGKSATPSMGLRRNICEFRMPRPTWPKSLTNSLMNK